MSAEIVERRETPRPYYIISDSMVNFYFRYVSLRASLINSGTGNGFEKMARDYILENVGMEKVPAFVTDIIEY